jgi:hypothetical protein
LLSLFSHFWFATVQEVLQADWQEVWHSPQPPLQALFFRVAPFKVWICFMWNLLLRSFSDSIVTQILAHFNHFRLFFRRDAKSPAATPPKTLATP